jgi:L-lactate utilization protein LutC
LHGWRSRGKNKDNGLNITALAPKHAEPGAGQPDHAELPAGRIVPRIKDAWDLLRGERGELPRAINIVSGPSRTADVEQTIQLGAHGPRRLHVLLLLGDASG